MKWFLDVLRGMVIGLANVIPGVSGGTMMVSMGIYDKLIWSINNLFKKFKQCFKILLPYLVGMLLAIVLGSFALKAAFKNSPLPTNTLFIGLILGGLGLLIKKVDTKKINGAAIIAFVCLFALIIWMGLQNRDSIQNADTIDMNIGQMLLMVLLGAVASATMIIPGVSGSLVLMLLGYYKAVTSALQILAHGLIHFDFSTVGQPLLMLVPFLIGIVLGIFGVAKLIEWLTARYPTVTYCGVLGLVIASPVSLLIQTDMSGATASIILISIAAFAVGFAGAYLLAKNSKE